MAKTPKLTPEQEAHAKRVEQELAEQKEILARVKEDSDRYEEAVKKAAALAESGQEVLDLDNEVEGEAEGRNETA